ncbi:uncharacterized protein LOC134491076 [Candoia aspera]|uniref:uncharacterized protein LOC134491076 n=1 Tax=Candoia aspera TaxID=51853 RepID=UPI002FD7FAB6
MAVWERLRLPFLWAATALCIAKGCKNYTAVVGIEGEDIVLSPLVIGSLTGISWKKEENLVADSKFTTGKEKQRISLDSSSGRLFLKNLSQQDSGNYTAQAFINERIMETCFVLKVLGCKNYTAVVGIEGEDIVLSPLVIDSLTGISWKKEESLVADSKFTTGKEKQRISLDSSSGRLFLKNLSQQDSGNYTAQAFINERIKKTCFVLKVLVLPDINCTVNNDTIQLSCTSASQGLSLSYSWDYIGYKEIINENHQSVIQLRRNSDRFQKITCYISAFGSLVSASKSINLSDCIPEEPGHQSRNRIYLILVIITPVVILICWLKVKIPGRNEESRTLNKNLEQGL